MQASHAALGEQLLQVGGLERIPVGFLDERLGVVAD